MWKFNFSITKIAILYSYSEAIIVYQLMKIRDKMLWPVKGFKPVLNTSLYTKRLKKKAIDLLNIFSV